MGAPRHRRLLGLLAIVSSLLVTGCGGDADGPSSSGDDAQLRRLLVASADKLESAQTASFDVTMAGTMGDQRIVGTGSGVMDFAGASASLRMTLDVDGQSIEMDEIVVGTTAYVRPSGTEQWMSIQFEELAGADPSQALMSDPTASIEMLAAAAEVERIGTEQVDGVDTTHYRTELDLSTLDDGAAPGGALLEGTIPSDVWIDEDGLPRKQVVSFQMGQAGTFEMTMRYDDFGTAVSIEAPDSSDVTAVNPASLGPEPAVR